MMTHQEVFNKAVLGLLKQAVPSRNKNGFCTYRSDPTNPASNKCAVGQLMPDDKYLPLFDDSTEGSTSVSTLSKKQYFREALVGVDLDDQVQVAELGQLQQCHDVASDYDSFVSELKVRLEEELPFRWKAFLAQYPEYEA